MFRWQYRLGLLWLHTLHPRPRPPEVRGRNIASPRPLCEWSSDIEMWYGPKGRRR